MGVETLKQLTETLQVAGGYGIAAVFVWLYLKERGYSQSLVAKIIESSVKNTEATVVINNTLASFKDLITQVLNVMRKE